MCHESCEDTGTILETLGGWAAKSESATTNHLHLCGSEMVSSGSAYVCDVCFSVQLSTTSLKALY